MPHLNLILQILLIFTLSENIEKYWSNIKFMISIIQIPHLPSQIEYYVGYGLLPLFQNICNHVTFPNVPSHLLGRRHSPLHLIINIYLFISHSKMYPHIY